MTRSEFAKLVGAHRAEQGLPPAVDEVSAWAAEMRVAHGAPPKATDEQIEMARAILAVAGYRQVAA